MKVYFIGYLVALGCFWASCSAPSVLEGENAYNAQLNMERLLKDKHFGSAKNSPFYDLGGKFKGLNYFEPDSTWNCKGKIIQPDTTYLREIIDTKGGIRKYTFSGYFVFSRNGKSYQIPIWRDSKEPDILFVMFHDLTNGTDTYGGGRYIEMPWPSSFVDFRLDFNKAFNPYCHYNHNYACPVVPKDLTLDLRIEAGEKIYE